MADGSRGPIDENLLRELRLRADCREVAEWMGLRYGARRRYFCPSCQGPSSKTPDLSTPPHGGFKCHKCNAKGDALALVMLTRGCSFVEAVEWLAEHYGLVRRMDGGLYVSDFSDPFHLEPREGETFHPSGTLPSRVERPQHETEEATQERWHAWHDAISRSYPASEGEDTAAAWLESRGIPTPRILVDSGFVLLDETLASTSSMRLISKAWLEENTRNAIVFPVRSAADNSVAAMHIRSLIFDDGRKRRQVGKWQDPDGTPRGYGWAGAWRRAELLILCEGGSDTLAAEAMTCADPRIIVVGAENAKALVTWAEYMKREGFGTHGFEAHCCIVRHIDDSGEGQKRAVEATKRLDGTSSLFRWPDLVERLIAKGLDLRTAPEASMSGFDLARVLEIAKQRGADFETVREVFLEVLPLQPTT